MLGNIGYLKRNLKENEKIIIRVQEVGEVDIFPFNKINTRDPKILRIFKERTQILIPVNKILLVRKITSYY